MDNIKQNYERLNEDTYGINKVFRESNYDWPGDYEGRALLAFLCHFEINKKEIPTMYQMMELLKEKTNPKLYFGKVYDGIIIDEQQLSGHNWYLRALIKYIVDFKSELAYTALKSTVESLYLPILSRIKDYPLERNEYVGGVSGNSTNIISNFKLSTDVGCIFMCVDGLSKYYELTKDERVKELLDNYIEFFNTIDLLKYKFQTHTTLTCLRGILTLYKATKNTKYLNIVKEKFNIYLEHGMTLNYENYNWFNRFDTWTEPCCVVDSFILAIELYEITLDEFYKKLSRRIWFNGLQFSLRSNGGLGTNDCTTLDNIILKPQMYEAYFCCTMRYAEGLLYYKNHESWFKYDSNKPIEVDKYKRHFIDDAMQVIYKDKIVPLHEIEKVTLDNINEIQVKISY